MRVLKHGAVLALALFLAACGGGSGGATQQQTLRPGNAPDIVIFSMSGHCGILCNPPLDNSSYLADPQDAMEALLPVFGGLGLSIQVENYSDRFDLLDQDGDGTPEELGFLQLLEDMQFVFDNWIDGFSNPTRIVIIAHSHGATWAHIAASVKSNVPIEYLVSLDGICFFWPTEHQTIIQDWFQANGNPFGWDISSPCDNWPIPGRPNPYHTKDVAFDNVVINLEVRSSDSFTADCCDNFRLDGTQTGIDTFVSSEDHSEVHGANSAAMAWVQDAIVTRETASP